MKSAQSRPDESIEGFDGIEAVGLDAALDRETSIRLHLSAKGQQSNIITQILSLLPTCVSDICFYECEEIEAHVRIFSLRSVEL